MNHLGKNLRWSLYPERKAEEFLLRQNWPNTSQVIPWPHVICQPSKIHGSSLLAKENPLCFDDSSQSKVCLVPLCSRSRYFEDWIRKTAFDISCCQLKSGPSFINIEIKVHKNTWELTNEKKKQKQRTIGRGKTDKSMEEGSVFIFIFKEYSQIYQRKYCIQDAIKIEYLKEKNFKYKCWNFFKNLNEQKSENSLYKCHEGTDHFSFRTSNILPMPNTVLSTYQTFYKLLHKWSK